MRGGAPCTLTVPGCGCSPASQSGAHTVLRGLKPCDPRGGDPAWPGPARSCLAASSGSWKRRRETGEAEEIHTSYAQPEIGSSSLNTLEAGLITPHCSDGETKAQKDRGAPPWGAQSPPCPLGLPGPRRSRKGTPSRIQSWLPQTRCRCDGWEEGFPGSPEELERKVGSLMGHDQLLH